MKEIYSLIDYLGIICNRSFIADTSDYPNNRYLANMNEAVKEFIAKSGSPSDKESKTDFPSEELTSFIRQYHEYLYSYVYKRKSEAELNSDTKYTRLHPEFTEVMKGMRKTTTSMRLAFDVRMHSEPLIILRS